MKGYKAFNKDLTCRGMQYEIGKEYAFNGKPIPCKQGFHFCKSIAECYQFYDMTEDTRICEISAVGTIVTDDGVKYCTNLIKIVREIKNPRKKSNLSKTSSGYCNSGNCNSGDWNSGNWNSGSRNRGNCNSGNWNSGSWNSGDWNSGDRNSGNCNSGSRNSGSRNSGNWNSGNWNSGSCNSGVFNTESNPKIKIFDNFSDWTIDDWYNSAAAMVMERCPYTHSEYIKSVDMTDEEKEKHPEYKTIRGYFKTIVITATDKQKWWDGLSDAAKQAVYDLPNFDANKFEMCTKIKVRR